MVWNPLRDPPSHVGAQRAPRRDPSFPSGLEGTTRGDRDLRDRDGVRKPIREGDGVTTEERNVLEDAGLNPEIWEALA